MHPNHTCLTPSLPPVIARLRPPSAHQWVPAILAIACLTPRADARAADDAEPPEPAASTLDTVTVEAARTGQSIAELPRTVQIIERRQIMEQARSGKSLSEALDALVPALGPSSQTLTNFTQTLRGRDPLYLVDGVSLNSNRAISRQLTSVGINEIERIEVLSGATAIYGAGAAGGIINIVTRRASEPGLKLRSDIGVSAFTADLDDDSSQYRVSQSAALHAGRFDVYAGANYEVRHGFFDGNGDRIAPDPAQISRNDTDTWDLHLKGGVDLGSGRHLSATAQAFEDRQDTDFSPYLGGPGVPALFGMEVESRAVPGLVLAEQPYTKRRMAHLDYQDPNLLGQDFRAQAYWRHEEFRFYPFPGTLRVPSGAVGNPTPITLPYVNQSENDAEVYGLRTTFTAPLEAFTALDGRLTWGADVDFDHNEADAQQYDVATYLASGGSVHTPLEANFEYSPDIRTRSAAAFAQLDWQLTDRLSVQGGVRYQDVKVEVDDYIPISEQRFVLADVITNPAVLEGATLEYDAFVFNGGAVFALNARQDLFASFSQGFEQPDVARLLRGAQPAGSVPVVFAGQQPAQVSESELEAIETDAWELGWRGRFDAVEANLAAFYSQSDKTALFDGQFVTLTGQKKRIYGFEGAFTAYLTEHLSAGGNVAWVRGQTRVGGQWQALNAWEVAPPKIGGFVQWQEGDSWSLRAQVMRVTDDDDAADDGTPGGVHVDGYTTVDLIGSLRVGNGRLGLAVSNLFDQDYETVYAQQAGAIYGSFTRIPAFGRRLGLTYSIEY